MLAISAPHHHRIVELTAVLVDNAVEFRSGQGRCTHDDGILVQDVLTGLADGLCQMQIVSVELFQIVGDGNVAETEPALYVIHNHIDGHVVVFVQFPVPELCRRGFEHSFGL